MKLFSALFFLLSLSTAQATDFQVVGSLNYSSHLQESLSLGVFPFEKVDGNSVYFGAETSEQGEIVSIGYGGMDAGWSKGQGKVLKFSALKTSDQPGEGRINSEYVGLEFKDMVKYINVSIGWFTKVDEGRADDFWLLGIGVGL